ncbi:MAG: M99 family metallo-carboxypeptidase C-terminal domain-containing protein [Candidatus Omnitrophota bacterium]
MENVAAYMLALTIVAFGFLALMLALIALEINKAKFALALVLSLGLIGLGGYHYYLIMGLGDDMKKGINLISLFTEKTPASGMQGQVPVSCPAPPVVLPPAQNVALPEPTELTVIIEVAGRQKRLKDKEHLKVKRGEKIKIVDGFVPKADKNLIRVNMVGFIADPKKVAEDRGSEIDTASLLKKFSVDKKGNCYKIEVLKGKEIAGNVFLDLIP